MGIEEFILRPYSCSSIYALCSVLHYILLLKYWEEMGTEVFMLGQAWSAGCTGQVGVLIGEATWVDEYAYCSMLGLWSHFCSVGSLSYSLFLFNMI